MLAQSSSPLLWFILGALAMFLILQLWQIIPARLRPRERGKSTAQPATDFHLTAAMPDLRPGQPSDQYWRWHSLTLREREIVRLAVMRMQNTDIARELQVSPDTVSSHFKNIYRKLDVHSRLELADLYHSLGL